MMEYDGIQYFDPTSYFSTKEAFSITQEKDFIKSRYALASNIHILRIPYTHFENTGEIIQQSIFHLSGEKASLSLFHSNEIIYEEHIKKLKLELNFTVVRFIF